METYKRALQNEFKKRLYVWVLKLLAFIKKLPRDMVCDVLGKQLLRSGTSVLANCVEARAGASKKDYINFFNHSLKSANESKMWLTLLRDSQNSQSPHTTQLLDEIVEIANILAASILTMKGKRAA